MRGSWRLKRRRKSGGVPDSVGTLIRRTLAGGLTVVALVTATPASAGQPPTELWEEFPLTQTLNEQSSPPPAPAQPSRPAPAAETRQAPPAASAEQAAGPLSYLVLGLIGLAIWACMAVALRTKGWRWTPDDWRPRAEQLAVALAGEQGEAALLPASTPAPPVRVAGKLTARPRKPRGQLREDAAPPPAKSQLIEKKHPRSDAPPGGKQLSSEVPGGKRLSGPPTRKQAPLPTPPRPAKNEPRNTSAPPAKKGRKALPVKKPAAARVRKAAPQAAKDELVQSSPAEKPSSPPQPTSTTRARPGARSRGLGAQAPPRFETCVIERWDGYVRSDFYAQAVRPDGSQYLVARSPMFSPRARRSIERERQVHEALVERLRADGWESQGPGVPWYRQRFRRPSRTLHDLVSDLQPPRAS